MGLSDTRLGHILSGMRERCANPHCRSYPNYGGRGIRVCPEWRQGITTFYQWAKDNGYAPDLTIDRIDPDGDYEPSNCRWITRSENSRRARKRPKRQPATILVTLNSIERTAGEWVQFATTALPVPVFLRRVADGWSVDKILHTPFTQPHFQPVTPTPGSVVAREILPERAILLAVAKGESFNKAATRYGIDPRDQSTLHKRWVKYGVLYADRVTDHGLTLIELWADRDAEPALPSPALTARLP